MWNLQRNSNPAPRQNLVAFAMAILGATPLGGCVLGLYDPVPPGGRVTLTELDTYLESIVADSDPPSVSVTVTRGDHLVYERAVGYADAPRAVRANSNTTYRWFSVTKPFTAAAILQLVESGSIALQEPAATYLPYLNELYGPSAREITIERLLSHRAGIGDVGDDILTWVHVAGHFGQSALLKERLPAHVHFDPGALDQGHYSNLGYMILGAVIEAVTKESYETYVIDHVLGPLGMTRTHFYYDAPFPSETRHAVGSHPDDFMAFMASFRLDLGALSRECTRQRYWFEYFSTDQTPPSGLLGTTSDMVRLGQMIVGRGTLGGRKILSETSVEHMIEPRAEVKSSPMGPLPDFSLGDAWFITRDEKGRKLLIHGGQGMAFRALLVIRPDDELVASIAANGTYLDGEDGLSIMRVILATDFESPKRDR
jgi:D-alanyl-D-alanine carboxypeptidase